MANGLIENEAHGHVLVYYLRFPLLSMRGREQAERRVAVPTVGGWGGGGCYLIGSFHWDNLWRAIGGIVVVLFENHAVLSYTNELEYGETETYKVQLS